MRTLALIVVAVALLRGAGAAGLEVGAAADRKWQTGTCTDVGTKRDLRVGAGAADSGGFVRSGSSKGTTPEVATYVFETDDLRIELQELQPIGPESLKVTVGDRVTFAVDKKTAYVRDAKGAERRLLVTKTTTKRKPQS